MTIAFDIDGVWSEAPAFWSAVFNLAEIHGHNPVIVTGRSQPKEKLRSLGVPEFAPIFISACQLKEDFCRQNGLNVDVWIDNEPGTIQRCKILDTSTGDDGL